MCRPPPLVTDGRPYSSKQRTPTSKVQGPPLAGSSFACRFSTRPLLFLHAKRRTVVKKGSVPVAKWRSLLCAAVAHSAPQTQPHTVLLLRGVYRGVLQDVVHNMNIEVQCIYSCTPMGLSASSSSSHHYSSQLFHEFQLLMRSATCSVAVRSVRCRDNPNSDFTITIYAETNLSNVATAPLQASRGVSFLAMCRASTKGAKFAKAPSAFRTSARFSHTSPPDHATRLRLAITLATRLNMATYADPDAHLSGAGPYVHQHGTPPAQQQQQQQPQQLTDPELRLQENLQQLREGGDIVHTGGPQQPQYQQLAQMPGMGAHQHFQAPSRPTHSPQQMAHAVMSLEGQHEHYDPNDPSRKRSKVSRACDECRRKKIRCDATSENGPEACSSCKRTGARCQFSRQPMKRGPSKGYIKELADRLNSLESQIQQPQNASHSFDFGGMGDQTFVDTQSPPQFKRQRTHSMTEGFHETFARPNWSAQDREPSLNGNRRTSFGEMTLAGSLITGVNEGTLRAYYNNVHPTLPILPHNDSALNRLTNCPAKLREALFLALEACVRSFAAKTLPSTELSPNQLLQQCFTAVDAAKYSLSSSDHPQQLYNNLVFCQSLILLAAASDRPGPGVVGSTAQLLGQLAGCITETGLNDSKIVNALKEQDFELFQTARRVFWVAFILDRFHASSRSKDLMLPLHVGSLTRDDYSALGEVGYHLARAAKIVGQIAFVNRAGSVPEVDTSSSYAFSTLSATSPECVYLNGQLADFRESIEITELTNTSPPYLAYQYLRVFVARLSSQHVSSAEVLRLTKDLLINLMNGATTPLHHILAALVATSLTELSDRVETQVEAHAGIKELSDALANGQIIHRSSDGLGWDAAIRELLHQKKTPTPPLNASEPNATAPQPNMAGLQHLAAAAVGEREGADAPPSSVGGDRQSSQPSKVDHDLSAAMAAANEAALAQATAAAAQQLSVSPVGNTNDILKRNTTVIIHQPCTNNDQTPGLSVLARIRASDDHPTLAMGALTLDQVAIIKSTVPVLAEHGTTITTKFYADMLAAHPELKNVFNNTHQATGHQPAALAGALYAYASNIDNLGALSPAVELICYKHASLFIRPEQYDIVGEHLINTLKAVLGDAGTPELLNAWGAAYSQLADIMIGAEAKLYKETSYWPDWKDFTITKKEKESEEITSFYLTPVDGMTLPIFKPGQYISVNVFVSELDGGLWQARQYSLSDAPGKPHLRISVKRERGIELGEPKHFEHPGYISNILHDAKSEGDVIRLSHPFGDFFFDEDNSDSLIVLISAGVGLTALTSIFNHLTAKKSSRPITWIQGARSSRTRAFKANVDAVAANNENVHTLYFSSSPVEDELEGQHYDIKGRVDLDRVDWDLLFTGNDNTRYFVCGPTQFMLDVEAKLKSFGVSEERVKMELFGTGGVPRV
ncbi:hypothetical protein T440DRAFT_487751 [Plenodomus tracheiphilus IPT5]|uniref:nitric oxide dioxygenase n=1 Tax=Plenodomus tracheiphilus IPT5 TaxID=1408161 RepID=A0A6A7BCT3_9PLEO|nr:hypothetical protein T440DRAFT_487751 [Plenodomus tracheiphilus IPT5]